MLTAVIVALIAAGPAWVQLSRLGRHMGRSNGSGSVTTMLESTLVRLGRIENEVSKHVVDRRAHPRD